MNSILLFLLIVPVLGLILLSVNFLLAPHNPYKEKKTPFECGYHSFLAQSRAQFTIGFFLFAILFLAFDIELTSIVPFFTSTLFNRTYGFFVALAFILILSLGFVFELGKNALKFETKQDKISLHNGLLFETFFLVIKQVVYFIKSHFLGYIENIFYNILKLSLYGVFILILLLLPKVYSFMCHVSLYFLGVFSNTAQGIEGGITSSLFNMSYGLYIAVLFVLTLALGFIFEKDKNPIKLDTNQKTVHLASDLSVAIEQAAKLVADISDDLDKLDDFIYKFNEFVKGKFNVVFENKNIGVDTGGDISNAQADAWAKEIDVRNSLIHTLYHRTEDKLINLSEQEGMIRLHNEAKYEYMHAKLGQKLGDVSSKFRHWDQS